METASPTAIDEPQRTGGAHRAIDCLTTLARRCAACGARLQDGACAVGCNCRGYVRDHPGTALAAALAAGFLLRHLLRPR